jgi:hypothetical protein
MRQLKRLTGLALCVVLPITLMAAEAGHKVKYDGGSIPGVKAGNDLRVNFDSKRIWITKDKVEVASILPSSITDISYGVDVHRRVGAAVAVGVFTLGAGALLALAKSKKHFIGLTWDENGTKGGAAFQADKDDYRGLLIGLEGVTGKKAVDSVGMGVKN